MGKIIYLLSVDVSGKAEGAVTTLDTSGMAAGAESAWGHKRSHEVKSANETHLYTNDSL